MTAHPISGDHMNIVRQLSRAVLGIVVTSVTLVFPLPPSFQLGHARFKR